MRKRLLLAPLFLVAVLAAGCASPVPTGVLYTSVKLPVAASGKQAGYTRVGVAKCHTILGLVARGDASIDTAAKNGGIKVIHHVDFSARNILGIAGEYTTTVYGE